MSERMRAEIAAIEKQQGKEGSTVWCVGEQLKDMLADQPELAELIAQDLDKKELALAACEKQIKAFADERHKKTGGTAVAVTPREAERIIREFYGLPERGKTPAAPSVDGVIDLADFF